MKLLKFVTDVFLWPGEMVRRMLGITMDEDNGILRSLINMIFWGIVTLTFALWLMK
jgi:hypothetical protein